MKPPSPIALLLLFSVGLTAGPTRDRTVGLLLAGRLHVPGTEDLVQVLQGERARQSGDPAKALGLLGDFPRRFPQSTFSERAAVAVVVARAMQEPLSNLLQTTLGPAETTGLFQHLIQNRRPGDAARVADARVMATGNYLEVAPLLGDLAQAWLRTGTNVVTWVTRDPNLERRWRYGRLFYRTERFGEAEKIFASVTPGHTNPGKTPAPYEEGHFYLASCAFKRGAYKEADAHLLRFLAYWPESATGSEDPRTFARHLRISSLEKQGRWNEAWVEATNAWAKYGDEKILRLVFRQAKNLGRFDYPQWRELFQKKFPGNWSVYVQQRDDALNLLLQKKIPEGLALLEPLYTGRQSEFRTLAGLLTNGNAREMFNRNEEPFFDSLFFDPKGEAFFSFPYRERTEALLDLQESAKFAPDLMKVPRAYLFPMEGPKWQQLAAKGHTFINWVDDGPLLPEPLKDAVALFAILGEREGADALVRRHPFGNDWDRHRARKAVAIAFGDEDKALRQDLLQLENRKGEWNGLPHEFLRRGFPRWREPLIAHASSVNGVPRHLIWAVIREESHFEVDAVSSAGARGLMQIMEFTGKGLLQQAGLSRQIPMNLADPVQNVMLGSRYLASLLKMFQGDEMKVLVGYNGGEGNVWRWQKNNGPFTNALHFAMVVPFDESQRYLVKVLRSKWMYDVLYPEFVEVWKP